MARIGELQPGRALSSAESLPESVSSVKSVVKLQQGRALSNAESFLTTDYTDKHGWKASTGQRFGERGIFPIRGIREIRGQVSKGPRTFESGIVNHG
jgi:hypothetical protein